MVRGVKILEDEIKHLRGICGDQEKIISGDKLELSRFRKLNKRVSAEL